MVVRYSIIHILIIVAVVYFIFSVVKGCKNETSDLTKNLPSPDISKENSVQDGEKVSLPKRIWRNFWETYKAYWRLKAEHPLLM